MMHVGKVGSPTLKAWKSPSQTLYETYLWLRQEQWWRWPASWPGWPTAGGIASRWPSPAQRWSFGVAAQAVHWPGIPKVACSRPSGCSKSCYLQPAFEPCNTWSSGGTALCMVRKQPVNWIYRLWRHCRNSLRSTTGRLLASDAKKNVFLLTNKFFFLFFYFLNWYIY